MSATAPDPVRLATVLLRASTILDDEPLADFLRTLADDIVDRPRASLATILDQVVDRLLLDDSDSPTRRPSTRNHDSTPTADARHPPPPF